MSQSPEKTILPEIIPPPPPSDPFKTDLIKLVSIAAIYFCAVQLGLFLADPKDAVAAIWPASGVALAVLLLNPKQQWGKILTVIFFINAIENFMAGHTLLASLGFALANTLEPYLGAWTMTRVCGSKIIFERPLEIFALLGVAIAINGLTSLLGATVPLLDANHAAFYQTWWLWAAADGLGIILITPIIVTWAIRRNPFKSITVLKVIETILLVVALVIFAWLLFGKFTNANEPILRNYMVFPLLILIAFRFAPQGMSGTLLFFSAIAIWNTAQGYGIFSFADQTRPQRMISVQIFLIVTSFSGLLLSAIITERRRAEKILRTRLHLSQFAEKHPLDDLLQTTLDEAETLTHSSIGFFHFLEADQKTLQLQMWSTNTIKNMCTAEGKGSHYAVDQAGVWVDCVHTRSAVIYNDYPSLAHRKGLPVGHAPVKRMLSVPILRDDRIVMIIGVGNKKNDYDQIDVKIITDLADSVWDLVQRKRAEEALRLSEEKYRTVAEFTYDWEAWRGPDNRYVYVSPSCERVTGYKAEDFLANPDLVINITHESDRSIVKDHFSETTSERKEEDAHFDYRIIAQNGDTRWVNHFCNPVYGQDGRWLGRRESNRDITERKLAEEALQRAQKALTNINIELQKALAREKQLAHTDELTGISNRRHLYELADHEFEIAVRYEQPLSVVMFDIDHFKKVNDTYGHNIGDQILQHVAQIAQSELRSVDVIGRYGGEEFVIVLPMTNAQQAYSLAERIRLGVEGARVPTEKGNVTVTLSIGIVEKPEETKSGSAEGLIREADRAMYAAKQAGRNRTVIGE